MATLFWLAFSVTFLLLLTSLWAGLKGRRKLHLWVAPSSFVALTIAVIFAERLVNSRDFPADDLEFHLHFAYSAAGLAVPVIISGIWLARSGAPSVRILHRSCVALFMLAVLTATTTGIWVYSLSTPK